MIQLSEAFLRNVPHPCAEAAEAGIISFVNCLTSEIDTVVGNACASVIGNLSGRVDDVQLAMYRHPLLIDALVNVALGSLSIETVTRAAMALSMMAKEADAVVLIARAKLVVPGGTPFQLMADRCGATAGPREEAFEVTCFRRYWYVRGTFFWLRSAPFVKV